MSEVIINLKKKHLILYVLFAMLFVFASCESNYDNINSDLYLPQSRSVQMSFADIGNDDLGDLTGSELNFLFYMDGKLLQRVSKSTDEDGVAVIDVPLDESVKLLVVAGGEIKNQEFLNELEITTGIEHNKDIFISPLLNVQTNGSNISLTMKRIVGKVGVRPTDSHDALNDASFDSVEYTYKNIITGFRPGAENQYVYNDVVRKVTVDDNFESMLMSIAYPDDISDDSLVRIDIDYYKSNALVGKLESSQPLSGIQVKSSAQIVLELSLIKSLSPNLKSSASEVDVSLVESYNF